MHSFWRLVTCPYPSKSWLPASMASPRCPVQSLECAFFTQEHLALSVHVLPSDCTRTGSGSDMPEKEQALILDGAVLKLGPCQYCAFVS